MKTIFYTWRFSDSLRQRATTSLTFFNNVFLLLSFFISILSLASCETLPATSRFIDVTVDVGLKDELYPLKLKYSGAVISDLDSDGWPDLLLGHHTDNLTIYFNARNGSFVRHPFSIRADIHGITPFRKTPKSRTMNFLFSLGGSNGTVLLSPRLFEATKDRVITEKIEGTGLEQAAGRGRTSIPIKAGRRNNIWTDIIVLNGRNHDQFSAAKAASDDREKHHFLMVGEEENEFLRRDSDLSPNFQQFDKNWWGTVTDINNDGRMELLTFHSLNVYTNYAPYSIDNITSYVLPRNIDMRGISAIAELDYDNDGWFDLMLTRSTSSHGTTFLRRIRELSQPDDILLRNVNGKYVDVTLDAGIPRQTESKGLTTGDFNNDGWVDVLIIREYPPHLLLLNKQDGTFEVTNAKLNNEKDLETIGDMATAVDYDLDGKVDVILSEGHYASRNLSGTYRVLKNIETSGNYLLVRVGSSPSGFSTSLHAVVTIRTSNNPDRNINMKRRVGTPGTAVSSSYIEVVHFGLGSFERVASVKVKWTDGTADAVYNIEANQLITIGSVQFNSNS